MLKNLAYIMPIVGRVSMGELVREEGKVARPKKNDHFTITTQAKKQGVWVEHPIAKELASKDQSKLQAIPIRVLFDKVDLNLNESYAVFDKQGRQLCRGNGEKAIAMGRDGQWETTACPGAAHCTKPYASQCSLLGRFDFSIARPSDPDTFRMEAFALRTGGYNSIRALRSKLELFHAAFGGLRGLPLKLVMRTKTAKASHGSNFYYADIDLDCTFLEGAQKVQKFREDADNAGLNLPAMDEMYEKLINGHIRETEDDLEEFEEIGGGSFALNDGWGDASLADTALGDDEQAQAVAPIQDWRQAGFNRGSHAAH